MQIWKFLYLRISSNNDNMQLIFVGLCFVILSGLVILVCCPVGCCRIHFRWCLTRCVFCFSLIDRCWCGLLHGLRKYVIWQKSSWMTTSRSILVHFSLQPTIIFFRLLMCVRSMKRKLSKKLCDLRLCCKVAENYIFLGCYTVNSGDSLPMFQDNLSVLSSEVKKANPRFLTLENRTKRLPWNIRRELPLLAA